MVIALLLTLIPFLLVFCCKNRVYGFLSVFTAIVGFHLFLAIVTQAFHVFNYPVVIGAHVIFGLVAIVILIKNRDRFREGVSETQFHSLFRLKNLVVFAVFGIIFFELWSVHFNYTGAIATINGNERVQSYSDPYPIFSDEWAGVAFSNYAIASSSLPLVNPLWENSPFFTFLMPFHSMVAELFLFFDCTPLYAYAYLAIWAGMIICFFAYLFLRAHNVSTLFSALTVLFLPFIANGNNLPGLWYILPVGGGLIFLIVCAIADRIDKDRLVCASALVSFILYPPILVFLGPLFIARYLYLSRVKKIVKNPLLVWGIVVIVCAGAVFYFSDKLFLDQYIFRTNLLGGIPSFPLWVIVPWFLLPFFAIGVWSLCMKKMYPLVVSIGGGFIFWICYAFTMNVFVIDYPRVVFVCSVLIVIVAGLGLDWFGKKTAAYLHVDKPLYSGIAGIIVILVFFVASFSYTSMSIWNKLVLHGYDNQGNAIVINPIPPSNQYLTPDDIRFFDTVHNQVIVTVPWKGLAIGAADYDYPLQSKASEITNNVFLTQDFINGTCNDKNFWVHYFGIAYVYMPPFNCPNFISEGTSSEGLVFYKYMQ